MGEMKIPRKSRGAPPKNAARAHYDLEMMWNDAPRISYTYAVNRNKSRSVGRAEEPSEDTTSPSDE